VSPDGRPETLIDRLLSRRSVAPDDPMLRHVAETLAGLEPDPLFRRRLRAETINRHVAGRRERALAPSGGGRQMGRLGRAVLYASVVLALSATAVGAAAQRALPGDPLYGVKLRLEELRIDIAPASQRPALVSLALDQRLAELERLTADEEWQRASQAVDLVDQTATRLADFGLGQATPGDQAVARHAAVLNRLLVNAPEPARQGLERAIQASGAATGAATTDHAHASGADVEHGRVTASPHPTPRSQARQH
jgi:Domain of unknown function (DUF5667)